MNSIVLAFDSSTTGGRFLGVSIAIAKDLNELGMFGDMSVTFQDRSFTGFGNSLKWCLFPTERCDEHIIVVDLQGHIFTGKISFTAFPCSERSPFSQLPGKLAAKFVLPEDKARYEIYSIYASGYGDYDSAAFRDKLQAALPRARTIICPHWPLDDMRGNPSDVLRAQVEHQRLAKAST